MPVLSEQTFIHASMSSPIGVLTIVGSESAIVEIRFPATGAEPALSRVDAPSGSDVVDEAVTQLVAYFAGTLTQFDVPLDPVGTEFQKAAWTVLRTIPFAETISYGEQAARMGRPTASRAVGAANGRNPIPIVVPCHRVVGSDGSLTGFAGGLDVKRRLLAHEARVASRAGGRA